MLLFVSAAIHLSFGIAGHERGHDEEGTLAVLAEHLHGDTYALERRAIPEIQSTSRTTIER